MKICTFLQAAFRNDPHLRNENGLYYNSLGRPVDTDAGDLLSRFIVREVHAVTVDEQITDTGEMKTSAVIALVRTRSLLLQMSEVFAQCLDGVSGSKELYITDILELVDRSYPDGFTASYHTEDGEIMNFDQSGDTLAKWLVYEIVTTFPPASMQEGLVVAVAAMLAKLAVATARIHEIERTIANI